ncbi:MAG: hydroxymethylbilane synthase [Puniceicoccales bacterium]|jgi:hydroxymethylbilane synthase|nr:hydroxymethylbilane synthase [Puniceicoccales bacterium]
MNTFPSTCTLLTRGSPLARRQAEMSAERISARYPDCQVASQILLTTGDRHLSWALEKSAGKGLFTTELESALHSGKGDIAVHSAKDIPTEMMPGLVIAGFLPRANPSDTLVRRESAPVPATIATGSPRRRAQARFFFPRATFIELRGNVETRLAKTAAGEADATFLATAGLARLGIASWPGLVFEEWTLEKMIPAAGQGAIAWQVRAADAPRIEPLCDNATGIAVRIERAFLAAFGEGCHSAFAAHYHDGAVHLFREGTGRRILDFDATAATGGDTAALAAQVAKVLRQNP